MRGLSNVQVLRGIAALLVVVFHIREEIAGYFPETTWPEMTFGSFGVDIFFVISGFILVYATSSEFGHVRAAPNFMLRRLARIVPLYWAVTSAYVAFMVWSHQDPGYTAPYLTASYVFLPYPQPDGGDLFPAYSLGWTLEYEMFFYACLAGVIALPRTIAVATLSAVLLGFIAAGELVRMPWPLNFWSDSQVGEFVLGMLLAEARLRGFRVPGWVCLGLTLASAAAVLGSLPSMDNWWPFRGMVWGPAAGALVAAAVLHPPSSVGMQDRGARPAAGTAASSRQDRFPHRPDRSGEPSGPRQLLERLGDASYSVYLVHYLVFVLVARLLRHHLGSMPSLLYAAILLMASIGAAAVTYRYFEWPVTRYLQGRLYSALPRLRARTS